MNLSDLGIYSNLKEHPEFFGKETTYSPEYLAKEIGELQEEHQVNVDEYIACQEIDVGRQEPGCEYSDYQDSEIESLNNQ